MSLDLELFILFYFVFCTHQHHSSLRFDEALQGMLDKLLPAVASREIQSRNKFTLEQSTTAANDSPSESDGNDPNDKYDFDFRLFGVVTSTHKLGCCCLTKNDVSMATALINSN